MVDDGGELERGKIRRKWEFCLPSSSEEGLGFAPHPSRSGLNFMQYPAKNSDLVRDMIPGILWKQKNSSSIGVQHPLIYAAEVRPGHLTS